MYKTLFISSILLFFAVYFSVCSHRVNAYEPEVIKVGVLPDQSVEQLLLRYKPLLQYLERVTGINFELVVPDNYEHLLELLKAKDIDLAYFGGYTFLKANELYGAKPLVMREKDLKFTSSFIAKTDTTKNYHNISDFKGKRFSFGSKLSTSGHLMPRYFLKEWGIEPEQFFEKIYHSDKHDETAFLVNEGTVDLGVVNTSVLTAMFSDGRLKETNISVIKKTTPYSDYVWAIQAELGNDVVIKIRNAFLNLSIADKKHQNILKRLDAKYFIPAGVEDFSLLKQSIRLIKHKKE